MHGLINVLKDKQQELFQTPYDIWEVREVAHVIQENGETCIKPSRMAGKGQAG